VPSGGASCAFRGCELCLQGVQVVPSGGASRADGEAFGSDRRREKEPRDQAHGAPEARLHRLRVCVAFRLGSVQSASHRESPAWTLQRYRGSSSHPVANRFYGNVDTFTGTELWVVVPFPSCPLLLRPQQASAPVALRAQACESPTWISTALVRLLTVTGTRLGVVVPFPSCPCELSPQH
jgi:hypothetical protein